MLRWPAFFTASIVNKIFLLLGLRRSPRLQKHFKSDPSKDILLQFDKNVRASPERSLSGSSYTAAKVSCLFDVCHVGYHVHCAGCALKIKALNISFILLWHISHCTLHRLVNGVRYLYFYAK